jgi:hypothetical protein
MALSFLMICGMRDVDFRHGRLAKELRDHSCFENVPCTLEIYTDIECSRAQLCEELSSNTRVAVATPTTPMNILADNEESNRTLILKLPLGVRHRMCLN